MSFNLSVLDYGVIILYLLGMVAIGAIFSKKVTSNDDYALAGRSLTIPVMVGTSVATCVGASAAFGNMGLVQKSGVITGLITLGLWFVGWGVLIVMAIPLRRSGAITLPDFLSKKFGRGAGIIASAVTVIQQVASVAAQCASIGAMFALFGLTDKNTGIIIGGVVILLYTITGGFYAVAVTDVVQCVLLIVCLIGIVPVFAFSHAGGVAHVFANTSWDWSAVNVPDLIALALSYFIAAGAHASYTQRILASKDEKTAFVGSVISNGIGWIANWATVLTACAIPFVMPDLADHEQFVCALIGGYFPPVIKGLFISAILACVMSTADSFLIMAGTTFSCDVVKPLFPKLTDKKVLMISRITTLTVAVLGIGFALGGGGIFHLFQTGAAAYGAAIFIPLLCGVFWKGANSKAIDIAMVVGCATTLLWNKLGLKAATDAVIHFPVDGVLAGVILCAVVVIAGSLILGVSTSEEAAPELTEEV